MINKIPTNIYYKTGPVGWVFTFDWSSMHWRRYYRELSYIQNIVNFPNLDKWQPLMEISSGLIGTSYALLYLNDSDDHVKLVANMIVDYGYNEVKFIKDV